MLFLLHARHVPLSDPLSLGCQLENLLVSFLCLHLHVLLIALGTSTAFPISFDVLSLLVESYHFEIDQFVLELVDLQFGVHAFNFSS